MTEEDKDFADDIFYTNMLSLINQHTDSALLMRLRWAEARLYRDAVRGMGLKFFFGKAKKGVLKAFKWLKIS